MGGSDQSAGKQFMELDLGFEWIEEFACGGNGQGNVEDVGVEHPGAEE